MNHLAIAGLLLGLGLGGAAHAAGNADDGAAKSSLCSACHGLEGISSNPLWPNLAGQHADYLTKQIKAFRDGVRREPTMAPFVETLSDQDAEDLGAYFAGLKACP